MIKKLLKIAIAAAVCILPRAAHAFNPVRQVQISTNTLAQQSGAFNVQSGSMTVLNVTNTLKATGTVSLGGAASSVTISSNTILPGATFYQNGVDVIQTLYTKGLMVAYSSFTTAASSTTGVATYAKTDLCSTITPRLATDLIKITAVSPGNRYNIANLCDFTILRGNTDLSNGTGFCQVQSGSGDAPCSMASMDLPNTTSATTYCVAMKATAGGSCTWNIQSNNSVIIVEDYSQQ